MKRNVQYAVHQNTYWREGMRIDSQFRRQTYRKKNDDKAQKLSLVSSSESCHMHANATLTVLVKLSGGNVPPHPFPPTIEG